MTIKLTEAEKHQIIKATHYLEQYKTHLHHARRFPGIGSPKFDGMPKSPNFKNSAEEDIINHVDDPNRAYCDYVFAVVISIQNENYEFGEMLEMLYFGWHTAVEIQERFHISKNPYYDDLKRAKLIFAESCNFTYLDKLNREAKKITY